MVEGGGEHRLHIVDRWSVENLQRQDFLGNTGRSDLVHEFNTGCMPFLIGPRNRLISIRVCLDVIPLFTVKSNLCEVGTVIPLSGQLNSFFRTAYDQVAGVDSFGGDQEVSSIFVSVI